MKLIHTKSPSGWDGFQNPDSGLLFESYLRDVPKGHIGLKCYLHNKPVCQAIALGLGKVGLKDRTVHGYVVSLEAMRQTFMPLDGATEMRSKREQFNEMYPQIIEGWEMILGNDPPPKDGIRVELFFASLFF
jgi:hypothetical protein